MEHLDRAHVWLALDRGMATTAVVYRERPEISWVLRMCTCSMSYPDTQIRECHSKSTTRELERLSLATGALAPDITDR